MDLVMLWLLALCLSVAIGQTTTLHPPVRNCFAAKYACDRDEECVHRIVYLHSTCTTDQTTSQTCSIDCRSAVMNLYQLPLGRALLLSDLSCVPTVRPQLARCHLIPTSQPLYCSLAKMHCDYDDQCKKLKNGYLSSCEYKLGNGECPAKCAGLLKELYDTQFGNALSECVCWDTTRDIICDRFQSLLSICARQLYSPQSLPPTNQTNSTAKQSSNSPTSNNNSPSQSASSLKDSLQDAEVVIGNGLHEMQRLSASTINNQAPSRTASVSLVVTTLLVMVFGLWWTTTSIHT